MPRNRDPQGRFIKQNPPSIEVGPSKLTTLVASKPTIKKLEEKQRTGQILTLIERQTLLALEVKRKQSSTTTPTSRKQKKLLKKKSPFWSP